jgi:hypothetical protein
MPGAPFLALFARSRDFRRVPHFSRSLREVGFFADTLPTLSQRSPDFYSRQRMNMARAWAYREL